MSQAALKATRQADNRRRILDAALELFVDNGYAQVSMRNIAAKIGSSPGMIYSYFESKDDLFYALAEEGIRRLNASDPANEPSDDALEDVRATVRHVYGFSKTEPEFFALIFLDGRVPRVSQDYDKMRFMGPIWRQVDARIERCIEAGQLPPTLKPIVAWRLLIAPVLGLTSQSLSKRLNRLENVDELVERSLAVTIAGLAAGAYAIEGRDDSRASIKPKGEQGDGAET